MRAGLVENDRKPLLYFHTSNAEKFLQARLLADRVGLNLRQFRAGREPYEEDYELGSRNMLARAVDQVVGRVGSSVLFFVEDTSLRIEALSTEGSAFPGLAVKEWFQSTSFAELDEKLAKAGGDRRVSVFSDIALHVPGLREPVFFRGESSGRVAEGPPTFDQNEQHPWLTPSTFNGWFIPDGADVPLGALPLEAAEPLDFRAKSIQQVLARIEEYTAVLNLPPGGFRKRSPLPGPTLPMLFPPPQVLVVGRTCAGKTTFAEYASGRYAIQHIEASSVLRSLPPPREDDPDAVAQPSRYALAVLREQGLDAVARYIIENWASDLEEGFVVSGLRTIEEVAYFRRAVPSVQVVRIDAPERMRFARHLARGREGLEQHLSEFRSRDSGQDQFGLLPVDRELSDHLIDNVGTMRDYHFKIAQVLANFSSALEPSGVEARNTRLSRALLVLHERGPMTLPDIQEAASLGQGNASRVLGNAPLTTVRFQDGSGREHWQLSPSGRAYLDVLGLLPANPSES